MTISFLCVYKIVNFSFSLMPGNIRVNDLFVHLEMVMFRHTNECEMPKTEQKTASKQNEMFCVEIESKN